MARGRKANPAQSNVLTGNFRADRHSHGPRVETKIPRCPVWLPKSAKKHWLEIGRLLKSSGLISDVDQHVFAVHCDSFAKFEEVTRKLKELEDCLDETPQGYIVQSALFTVRNKLHEQIVKTAREFGMTPSARASIKTGSTGEQLPLSGWDEI